MGLLNTLQESNSNWDVYEFLDEDRERRNGVGGGGGGGGGGGSGGNSINGKPFLYLKALKKINFQLLIRRLFRLDQVQPPTSHKRGPVDSGRVQH